MRKLGRKQACRIRGGERILLSPGEADLISPAGAGLVAERITLGDGAPAALVGLTVEVVYLDCGCGAQEQAESFRLPRRR